MEPPRDEREAPTITYERREILARPDDGETESEAWALGFADIWSQRSVRHIRLSDGSGQVFREVSHGARWVRTRDHTFEHVHHEIFLDRERARGAVLQAIGAPVSLAFSGADRDSFREFRLSVDGTFGNVTLGDDGLPAQIHQVGWTTSWVSLPIPVQLRARPRAMSAKGRSWTRDEEIAWEDLPGILGTQLPTDLGPFWYETASFVASSRATVSDIHVWWGSPDSLLKIELVVGARGRSQDADVRQPGCRLMDSANDLADIYGPEQYLDEADRSIDRAAILRAFQPLTAGINASLARGHHLERGGT